jgi:multidrug resistance efflux pump
VSGIACRVSGTGCRLKGVGSIPDTRDPIPGARQAGVATKKAAIDVAKAELNQFRTLVEMHDIRSPVRGIVKAIGKRPGEAVKFLETVFVIQPEEN